MKSKPKSKGTGIGAPPPKGSKGILFTTDPFRTKKALAQVLTTLEKYCPPPVQDTSGELSLEDELKGMTQKKPVQFTPYVSEVSGNVFVRFNSDDPLAFCEKFFNALSMTGKSECPLVVKMYPILYSGFPLSEESLPALDPMLPLLFSGDQASTYNVLIHRAHKGDTAETHDELNAKIVAKVSGPHRPVFRGAEKAILWISLGRNLYIGVVPKWAEWAECNIPKLCAKSQSHQ